MGDIKGKIKIFALGNPFLGDAGVGLALGQELKSIFTEDIVEINTIEDSTVFSLNNINARDFIIVIKGLPSKNRIGSISQFTLSENIKEEFSKKYNYEEIPQILQNLIPFHLGEILIINTGKIDWDNTYSDEILKQYPKILSYLSQRIKNYSIAYE